jgi:MarR family transcriptional regulator, organic hydroperoxide resistance regulator
MEKGELNLLLCQISRLHLRLMHTEFTKVGITQGQPRILRYLKLHEGCIQRELCDHCHLEPATVTNVLEKMENKGFIKRKYEPGSRRNQQVFLTQEGQEMQKYVERVDELLEEQCFAGFSPMEKELAAGFLERICDNMIKAEEEEHNG